MSTKKNNTVDASIAITERNQKKKLLVEKKDQRTSEKMLDEMNNPASHSYLHTVQSEYRGDWQRFFIEWRTEMNQQQRKLLKDNEKLIKDNETLFEQNLQIQKELEILRTEADHARIEREQKLLRKNKRLSRTKQPLRDTITRQELSKVLNLVEGKSPLQISRRRLALVILYFTGLRVSNLLVLTNSNLSELLSSGRTVIPLIKGGDCRFPLVINNPDRKYINHNFREDFDILIATNGLNHFVFCNKDGNPISRAYLDRELNRILTRASGLLEKNLRTHSFRATYITDFLAKYELHDIQELIGHCSVTSTISYKRSKLTLKKRNEIIRNRPQADLPDIQE